MKLYIIRNADKDIQLVTFNSDDAIEFLSNNNGFHSIQFDVDLPETNLKSITNFNEKTYSPLHYNSTINFGIHKGKIVGDLIISHPDYLKWAMDNINLKLDEDCLDLLQQKLGEK